MVRLKSEFSKTDQLRRAAWGTVWRLLFRPSPRIAFGFRNFLLRRFGAKVGRQVRVYNSVEFFDPANAVLHDGCVLGPKVTFYCVDFIVIGTDSIISQGAHLCAATHDFRDPTFPLVRRPINVGKNAWICADAFLGPGVEIGDSAVVGARAVVFKKVESGCIVVGNPSRVLENEPKEKSITPAESA